MERYGEDSLIGQITDPRPEMFPESCQETIEKFQRLDKISDAELDFVVQYLLLTTKETWRLWHAVKIAPAELAERISKLFTANHVERNGVPTTLNDVILSQRTIISTAAFFSEQGRLPIQIEKARSPRHPGAPQSDWKEKCAWERPLYDSAAEYENAYQIKTLLRKWPLKYRKEGVPLTTEEISILLQPSKTSKGGLGTEVVVEGSVTHTEEENDLSDKFELALSKTLRGFYSYVRSLTAGYGIRQGAQRDYSEKILDDVFDIIRDKDGCAGVAFLRTDILDIPICLSLSNGLIYNLGKARQSGDSSDPTILEIVAGAIYENLAGCMSNGFNEVYGIKIKLQKICFDEKGLDDFSRWAAARMTEIMFPVAIGKPTGDDPVLLLYFPNELLFGHLRVPALQYDDGFY